MVPCTSQVVLWFVPGIILHHRQVPHITALNFDVEPAGVMYASQCRYLPVSELELPSLRVRAITLVIDLGVDHQIHTELPYFGTLWDNSRRTY